MALTAALAVVLVSCAPAAETGGAKISVIATIFAPYDFARQIAGDRADVAMLLPPGGESHTYEPTPRDIKAVRKCDVFIYVGGESDAWVEKILGSMDTSHMQIVTLMDCVELAQERLEDGMQADKEEEGDGGGTPEYDEHVWTSPKNAMRIVEKITAALCNADPDNSGYYIANMAYYLKELAVLDAQIQNVVDNGRRNTLVFGDRFPFRYFADAYGLRCAAAFPGCAAETEATARTIRGLIRRMNDERIPVVLHVELSNRKMAETIARETGAEIRMLHACHGISKLDFDSGETYISLMQKNIEVLREALG